MGSTRVVPTEGTDLDAGEHLANTKRSFTFHYTSLDDTFLAFKPFDIDNTTQLATQGHRWTTTYVQYLQLHGAQIANIFLLQSILTSASSEYLKVERNIVVKEFIHHVQDIVLVQNILKQVFVGSLQWINAGRESVLLLSPRQGLADEFQ